MTNQVTDQEGFDAVAQSGSSSVWSGINNMPYPTEGEASVFQPHSTTSNIIALKVPHEAANIPNGAELVEMELFILVKNVPSIITIPSWGGKTNLSSSPVWTFPQSLTGTYQGISPDGDSSYWKIGSYTPTQIIEKLKSGDLYFQVWVNSGEGAGTTYIKSATVTITYTDVAGERAAIIVTLV